MLVVPAASPYRTLGEFIKAWKTNPGLPIAGGSAGGTDHMLTGLLAAAAGVDVSRMNYVPHSGGGETIASLVGNQVPAGVNGLAEFTSLIAAGRLRALAISSEKRLPGIDIPTFVEQGVNLTLANWRAVMAPPNITPQQRAELTSVVERMRQSADWKTLVAKNNWIDMYQSGPAFEAFLKDEDARATTRAQIDPSRQVSRTEASLAASVVVRRPAAARGGPGNCSGRRLRPHRAPLLSDRHRHGVDSARRGAGDRRAAAAAAG